MAQRARRRVAAALVLGCLLGASAAGRAAEGPGDFRQILAEAKERVFPAVVFLMPITERYEGGRREQEQIAGSGVLIGAGGECVTNWHVVDRALQIRCLLYDGSVGTAEVVGSDKETDLALLRIRVPGRTAYPHADLGDSDTLEEGQFVMAMGAPWGLSRSVSLGIVSCTTRFLPNGDMGMYNLWIQTDASINPGNSGGPLINTDGVVVGINALGTFFGGDLAFAIPSNVVREIVPKLREHGRVPRSYTGLRLQPLMDFERNIFYNAESGVLVAGVDGGSPAEAAGLRGGDLLLAVGGESVTGLNREDLPALRRRFASLPAGEAAEIRLRRGDTEETLSLVPRRKGRVEGEDFDCAAWDMTVKTINKFSAPVLHFFRPAGVYVQGTGMPGNAARSGVMPGDILLEVDGRAVDSLADLESLYTEIVADPERPPRVTLLVLRAGLRRMLVLDYATKYGQD
jgi:serine protease Do